MTPTTPTASAPAAAAPTIPADDPWVECTNCSGEGHHGFEEDSGMPYTCYTCYGAGRIRFSRLSDEERENHRCTRETTPQGAPS